MNDGAGPSSNTCPRWESHFLQSTSILVIPKASSTSYLKELLFHGWKKLGQPVPESNLSSDLNNLLLQQIQRYTP